MPLPATLLPLIQAPMAGAQGLPLALAVSAAGALGSLPAAMLTPEQLRSALQAWQAAGAPPLNLNFFCHTPPTPDAAVEAAWRAALAPFADELGVDLAAAPAGAGRRPFDEAMATLCAPFAPPVVSFHFGLPSAALLARVKAWGAKVLASATTLDEGLWLQAHGADAVIAQGLEAGGHRGHFLSPDLGLQQPTATLLPALKAALRCPVVAAGGIATAQEVRAAFAAGADAVQVGTAFLLCDEAATGPLHRAALAAGRVAQQAWDGGAHRDGSRSVKKEGADESPPAARTALTNLYTGRPARGLMTRLMRERGPLSPLAPAFPLATAAITPLRAAAEARGRSDFTPLWAGENLRGCQAVPAAQQVQALAKGIPAQRGQRAWLA